MEQLFKFLFGLAVFVYGLVYIGIFLLIIKIVLMFQSPINFLGLIIR
ncbi:MAG: hypothetical protein PHN91_02385 [Patescibacteria group bacterium]|nr:hypothetical protein [Patescibacteria group bacterium]MDD3435361.1 hypothetical protein [Patescibacteria group bacterium]MDD4466625.1 hypothetical protein [Patescibacteria group bacterium]